MRTIVLGKGFLGKKFAMRGYKTWDRNAFEITPDKTSLDQLDEFDVIVNCMAKSNTRWCEEKDNFHEALWSNGYIPKMLSDYCNVMGKQYVHISTGCLYDDDWGLPQIEEGFTTAHCNYVVTKWVGEMGCRPDDLILRPRLYFGDFRDRNNLLCKLPNYTQFITASNSYSSVDVVVDAVEALVEARQNGVFNVACDGGASVLELSEWLGLPGQGVTPDWLREKEHLYLVNNVMNLSKLKLFYQPPDLKKEILRCWKRIQCEG